MRSSKGNISIKIIGIIVLMIAVVAVIIFLATREKKTVSDVVVEKQDYEYFALYSKDSKVGVVNKEGQEIIKPEYTEIYIPNQAKDVFICMKEDEYSILNSKGNEIFKNFDDISVLMISVENLEMEKSVLSYKKGDKFGLVDLSEKKLTDAIYEEVSSLKNKPGYILVKKDGLYGVLDSAGNTIIEPKYNYVKSDEYCSEKDGYAKTGYIVSEKTKSGIIYGYIDYTGKMLVDPKYESIDRALEYDEDDIYLIVMENGKKGVLKNKKQIIKNKFQSINYYNISNIFIVNKNGKYGFYNEEGKEILSPKYEDYSVAGNYICVKSGELSELYDMHGNMVNKNMYKSIIETGNPAIFIAESGDGFYSIISKDMQIDEKYTNITYAFDNYFIFTNGEGKTGILNLYTGTEIEPEYDYIIVTGSANCLEAKKGESVTIFSKKIEKMVTVEGGIVENIGTDYLAVYSDKELYYFNKNGEFVENTEVFPDLKLYSIEKDGKWGFQDKDGNVVVDCKYDIVTEINDYGFAGICQDKKWGVIDASGKVIVVPTYELETYYFPKFIGKYQLTYSDGLYCIEVGESKK